MATIVKSKDPEILKKQSCLSVCRTPFPETSPAQKRTCTHPSCRILCITHCMTPLQRVSAKTGTPAGMPVNACTGKTCVFIASEYTGASFIRASGVRNCQQFKILHLMASYSFGGKLLAPPWQYFGDDIFQAVFPTARQAHKHRNEACKSDEFLLNASAPGLVFSLRQSQPVLVQGM